MTIEHAPLASDKRGFQTGAPSKLTPWRHKRICEAFAAGLAEPDAARHARCGTRSVTRWIARGRDANVVLIEHLQAMTPEQIDALDALNDVRPPPTMLDPLPLSAREAALLALIPDTRAQSYWKLWLDSESARQEFVMSRLDSIREVGRGYEAQEVTEKLNAAGEVIERTTRTKQVRNWNADAWALERLRPGQFARREHTVVTGLEGGPLEHDVRIGAATPDEIVGTMETHERDARTAEIAAILNDAGVFGPAPGSRDDEVLDVDAEWNDGGDEGRAGDGDGPASD